LFDSLEITFTASKSLDGERPGLRVNAVAQNQRDDMNRTRTKYGHFSQKLGYKRSTYTKLDHQETKKELAENNLPAPSYAFAKVSTFVDNVRNWCGRLIDGTLKTEKHEACLKRIVGELERFSKEYKIQ